MQNNLWFGQRDHVFDPVPADKQRYAVNFLLENGLNIPDYLVSPDILARIEPAGVADRILVSQRQLLDMLLEDTRCKRMSECVNRDANNAYSPSAMLADLRAGIFSELRAPQPDINLYRRNLQRAFVEQLGTFAGSTSASTDMPALARAELKRIQEEARKITAAKTDTTAAHLADLVARIERIFEPKAAGPERPLTSRSF